MLVFRSTSAIPTAPGSAARTRTPTGCCASTSQKAPISACTAPTTLRPWRLPSTAGLARPLAGKHRPRRLTGSYDQPKQAMLRRPLESAQYAAGPYRAVLERHGIQQSMSRRGNCLDNAPMESFFASLKTERVHEARFRTRAEARAAVFEYIEVFYNCSSERTSRYVLEENRLCCAGSGTAGCVGRRFALRTSARTAELSRVAWLKSHGPSSRGCLASITPRSAANRSVRAAMPMRAAAWLRFSQAAAPSGAARKSGMR